MYIGVSERNNLRRRSGLYNVLCLDISESMAQADGWAQANKFIRDFLEGIGEMMNLKSIS